MVNKLKSFLNKFPYIRGLYQFKTDYYKNSRYYPGHYYSPLISREEIEEREGQIWKIGIYPNQIQGIDFNIKSQLELVRQFETYYADFPFKDEQTKELRYYLKNRLYSYTDAYFLYAVIRHFKPQQIIEVGSGFSSALMLDVNDLFFSNHINLTFIEPFPQRLESLLRESDHLSANIIRSKVQDVSLEAFKKLEKGDVLFIDSTHVVKTGSDLHFLMFEVLPLLKQGVLIHFHDVFYPFEYPKEWVYQGRNWNENYFLRAFLMYNPKFKIKLFSHFLHTCHKDIFKNLPLCYNNFGGNLWLEKI